MTPRGFDKYFVKLGMGTHPKLARLTDSERCAHVFGVLALAAASPRRGCLLVGELPAEAVDVAAAAGVSRAVATTALVKLQAVGVLYFDGALGCLVVHDWEDVNPPPKTDQTNAERQAAYRARNAGSNATRNATHNGNVTPRVTTTEVEVEVEGEAKASPMRDRSRAPSKPVDQSEPPVALPGDLHHTAHLVLDVLTTVQAERGGDVPTIRGVGLAMLRFGNRDYMAVAREVEHWALAGRGSRKPVKDWARTFSTFLGNTSEGSPVRLGEAAAVLPFGRRPNAGDLIRKLRESEGEAS